MPEHMSECLPEREMELKRVDVLIRAQRRWGLRRTERLRWRHVQQIVDGAVKSEESRRVRAVAEIGPDRTYWCPDPEPEADAMHHIVKVLQVLLVEAKTDRGYIGIDVAHVMEEYAANAVSDQRKSQLGGMKEKSAAADGEPGQRISRSGLIVRKRAIGGSAAGIIPLREWNFG